MSELEKNVVSHTVRRTFLQCTVELRYDVMKGTAYFVSL